MTPLNKLQKPLALAVISWASAFGVHAQSTFSAQVQAQAEAVVPEEAASVPGRAKPAPKLQSPADKRDNTVTPGELRPERPVTPQLSIPVGKNNPGPATITTPRVARPGQPGAVTGGVDDAAARCNAETDAQERAACRDALARDPAPRPPG